jgi:pyridoxal phosphate enzyme (YggS family)
MSPIIERWESILKQIEAARGATKSKPQATLVAVSKGQPVEAIMSLLEAGQRDFGENRVQEALSKWPALKARYPDIRLHLIGTLQTNKVKEALALFDVMHTVDRESLVDALAKEGCKVQVAGCKQFFVQVNTGEEAQKEGVTPGGLFQLMRYIQHVTCNMQLATPVITGLMCIPPAGEPPAPHFALLRRYAEEFGLPCLSMGMSGDYETALRLGATQVRIGTALFGERKT